MDVSDEGDEEEGVEDHPLQVGVEEREGEGEGEGEKERQEDGVQQLTWLI